ncbi:MAG: dihydroorotase [Lachnospiraceae bacterium]|nr:dihydroorotase [Lachnospiraceae bacterium]
MLYITGGTLIDPASGYHGKKDIVVRDDRIATIANPGTIPVPAAADNVIDASGRIVTAGLVDPHVHFRDPGQTEKEDILTGAAAAAKGGYTSVIMMGNTIPHPDNADTIRYMLEKGARTGIRVYAAGNVTREMRGETLTDAKALKEAGAVVLTDDGLPVRSARVMREACKQAAQAGMMISLHEEDPLFIRENGINAGEVARETGLTGASREAEIVMVARDIEIARETGCTLTVQHISAAETVALIRRAKAEGVRIHAEATPHHFTLTEDAVRTHGTNAKMNPPLRTEHDRAAIIEGLADGTIEMIATDHAPHTAAEKARPFTEAPSGIIGLETALSLGIRELVNPGHLTMEALLKCMSANPARITGIPGGSVREGEYADLLVFDPQAAWKVSSFRSKAVNSPFTGETLPGVVHVTICGGKTVYEKKAE